MESKNGSNSGGGGPGSSGPPSSATAAAGGVAPSTGSGTNSKNRKAPPKKKEKDTEVAKQQQPTKVEQFQTDHELFMQAFESECLCFFFCRVSFMFSCLVWAIASCVLFVCVFPAFASDGSLWNGHPRARHTISTFFFVAVGGTATLQTVVVRG